MTPHYTLGWDFADRAIHNQTPYEATFSADHLAGDEKDDFELGYFARWQRWYVLKS